MKTTYQLTLFTISLWTAVLLLAACGKKEETSVPPASETPQAVAPPIDGARDAAAKAASEAQAQADAAKATADKAAAEGQKALDSGATDAQKQADELAAKSKAEVQALIEQAKAQVAEKKYVEALATLKELSSKPLSADQQTWIDQIKAQIQKAMGSQAAPDAAKSLGGLLPGTK